MKKILYILLATALVACNSKKQEKTEAYTATPNGLADLQKTNTVAQTATATGAQSNLLTNPEHGAPGHDCSIAVGAPLKQANKTAAPTPQPTTQTVTTQPTATVSTPQTTAATVNTNGQKLNPAHGQPGHDCAIAVGAPLGSKPVQAAVSTAQPKVSVSAPAAAVPNTPSVNAKGQKLNPAHGQPGHKCEVAVGAPLT